MYFGMHVNSLHSSHPKTLQDEESKMVLQEWRAEREKLR